MMPVSRNNLSPPYYLVRPDKYYLSKTITHWIKIHRCIVQIKMRIIDKATPHSNPKQTKIKKCESEFNCYKCFKILILNLWSVDQEGPVKIYGGGPRECSENSHQHCIVFSINSLCFVSTFSLMGHFEWHIVVRVID